MKFTNYYMEMLSQANRFVLKEGMRVLEIVHGIGKK